MSNVDPLFVYMSVLAVIQPARIQDIEKSAKKLIAKKTYDWMMKKELFRSTHKHAKEVGLVIQVRRGVYFTSSGAKSIVRHAGFQRNIDNRRLFLMKEQRRLYK